MAWDQRITSRRHPLVARLRTAATRAGDEVLLDGPHLVAEALASPWLGAGGRCALRLVVATDGAVEKPEVAGLCDAATARHIPVHLVPDGLAAAISPTRTPTGLVALAAVAAASLADTLHPAPALVVVLAGVQDPGNVGTIVRTAEAAGATGLVLLPGTADPFGWKALRASMGSALRLPLHVAGDALEVAAALRAAGLRLIAADSRPSSGTPAIDTAGPLALLIGGEGAGLPAALAAAADRTVRIDLAAPVDSLNAAIATAVLLFEVRRQRHGWSTVVGY